MGRPLRYDAIGACHHIVVKGANNAFIFDDDFAKEKYIALLVYYRERHDIKLFAYCIMDNHVHLFIQTGKPNRAGEKCIAAFMHDVQAGFARWYNKVYPHVGPVFNGRYQSFYCGSMIYFITLIDYIHRNPVKHNKLDTYNYRYSSYGNYQTGKGICDLEDCYQFLEMTRGELMARLAELKHADNWPLLEQLIEKLQGTHNIEAIEKLLQELAFKLEDLKGSRLIKYFDRVQRTLIRELVEIKQMPVRVVSKFFEVSTSYVYGRLKPPPEHS